MEWGFPSLEGIDIIGLIIGFFKTLYNILVASFDMLLDFVGGNHIAAFLIIGLVLYLIIDRFYHIFWDVPAARGGEIMTSWAIKLLVFLVIFGGLIVLMGSGI